MIPAPCLMVDDGTDRRTNLGEKMVRVASGSTKEKGRGGDATKEKL